MSFLNRSKIALLVILNLLIFAFATSAIAEIIEKEIEGEGEGAFVTPNDIPEGQVFSFNFDVNITLTLEIADQTFSETFSGGDISTSRIISELDDGTYPVTERYEIYGVPDSPYLEGTSIDISASIERTLNVPASSGYEIQVNTEISDFLAEVDGDFEGETEEPGILPGTIPMSLVSQAAFDEGEEIFFEAEYFGLITSDTTFTSVSAPPVINSLSIEVIDGNADGEPVVTSTLNAILDATDPEDGTLGADAATFRWLKNGSEIPGATGDTLSGNFVKGDSISVKAVVEDSGGKKSEPFESEPVTIVNSPPHSPTLVLTPEAPTALSAITVEITPGADPDNDPLEQHIKWEFNGAVQDDLAGQSSIGPGIPKGTAVKVTVTPNDGEADGEPATAEVTVGNAAPTINPIGDQSATEGQEFTLDLSAFISDPDEDALAINFEINPTVAPPPQIIDTTFTWTPEDIPAPEQTFIVTITATDNESPEVLQEFSITVENANNPPGIADIADIEVEIPPDDPGTADTDESKKLVSVPVSISDVDADQVRVQATSPDSDVPAIGDAIGNFNETAIEWADSPHDLTLEFVFNNTNAGNLYSINLFGNDNSGAPNGIHEIGFSISVILQGAAKLNLPPKLNIPDQQLTKAQDPTKNVFNLDLTQHATDPEDTTLTFEAMAVLPTGANLDASGMFTWNFDTVKAGVYIIPFKVTDEIVLEGQQVQSAQQFVTFTIIEPNWAPEIDTIASPQTVVEGNEISFDVTARDLNRDFLTFTAEGLPAWLIFDSATLSFTEPNEYTQTASGIPPFDVITGEPVTFDVTFIATDPDGESAETTVTVEVTDFNRSPVISGPDTVEVFENDSVSFPVSATDPDNDLLTFTKVSGQGVFNPDTLIYTLDLTGRFDIATASSSGEDLVQIKADDGKGGTALFEVAITIYNTNQPVTIESIEDHTVPEGEGFSIPIVATDPDLADGLPLEDFSASAIPELPFSTEFVGGSVNFTGTPGFEHAGVYNVTIAVKGDVDEDVTHSSFVLTVENTNRPPVADIPDLSAAGDERLVKGLSEFVTDPDGDSVKFSLVDAPEGLDLSASGLLVWTPVGTSDYENAQFGIHTIKVEIIDEPEAGTAATIETEFDIDVEWVNIPPYFGEYIGEPGNLLSPAPLSDVVVTAGEEIVKNISVIKTVYPSDADASINFSVASGKGSVEVDFDEIVGPPYTGSIIAIYEIQATYRWQTTAEDAGQHNISILAEDSQGAQTAEVFTVSVGGNPPVITSVDDIEIPEGELADGRPDEEIPVRIRFDAVVGSGDEAETLANENAEWTIERFDRNGRGTEPTLTPVASAEFEWTPGFDEDNKPHTYELEVKVTDTRSNLYDTERVAITVLNTNRPPILDPVSIDPAEPTGADNLTLVYTEPVDPDGDNVLLKTVWKKNGVTQPEYNDATEVLANSTLPGETWSVEVWANDPFDDSPKRTAEVTILDSPAELTVEQSGTGKGEDPIVINATYKDPDGTPPVVSVNLEIIDELGEVAIDKEITNSADPTSLVGEYIFESLFKTGVYTYTVSAEDATGILTATGTFEVTNASPVIYPPEVSGFASGNIPLKIGLEDPDGDAMNVEILYNGSPATVNGPGSGLLDGTYEYSWDSNADVPNATGETYNLEIVVTDGIDTTKATVDIQLFNIVGLWFVPRLVPIESPAPATVSVEGGLAVGVTYDFDEPWWFAYLGAWNFSTSLSVNGQTVPKSPGGSFWHFTFNNVQLDPEVKNEIQAKYTYEYVYGVSWYDTSVEKWKFDNKRGKNSGQPSDPIYVTVDTLPPEITILNPKEDDEVISTKTPKLTAKITDNYSIDTTTITFDIDGSTKIPDFNPDTGIATYTPPVGSPLGPGPHTFIASAKDKAGNPGTATREFVVDPLAADKVPPVLVSTTPADLSQVTEKRPVVSISVFDAQSKLDPESIEAQLTSTSATVTPEYTAIDIKSGTITFDYPEELEDGEHTASLSIADKAGNSKTFNWSFIVDTVGPDAPTLVVPECVADESLTVTGETEPGAKVKLILNDILYQEKQSDMKTGAYSFVDVPLATGTNTLQTIPIDQLGNLGKFSEKKTVIYDTVPPVISVSSPNPNQIVSKLDVPISATISDNCGVDTGTIELSVNGVPVTNFDFNENSGKLSFMTPSLPDNSTIPVTIAANDLSGLSNSYEFSFETRAGVADTTPPVIDNVSIAGIPVFMGDEVTIGDAQPEINASVTDADSEISTVSINDSGEYDETTGVIIYQPDVPQDDDTYTVEITATDTASPPNTASFLFHYTVKTMIAPPTVQLDPDVERTKAESIGVVVSDVAKGVFAVWNVNGVPVFSHKFTGENSYRRSVLLAEGENEIVVEVSDAFGNSNQSESVVVVKDTAAPSVNLVNPVNADIVAGGVVDVELILSDPSGIKDVDLQIEEPDGDVNTVTPSLSGAETDSTRTASYSIEANLDGIYGLFVIAEDGVSNSTQPKAFSFTADSTPPEVRINTPTEAEAGALPYLIPELTGYVDPNDVDLTSSIEITIDGEVVVHAYNAGSGQVTVTPQEFENGSTHTLTITASDSAGNENSASREFMIDTSAEDRTDPVVADFFPIPDSTISGTGLSLLQFTLSDSGGTSDLVTITINGETFKLNTLIGVQENRGVFRIYLDRSLMSFNRQQIGGGGGFQLDPLELGALERSFGVGTNTISVQASDRAGNTTTESWSFEVVTQPPEVPVLDEIPDVTSKKNITVTGTVTDVSSSNPVKVSILVNSTAVRTVKVTEEGKFSAENLILVAGDNQITTKASDQAGNQSKLSTPVEVVRDIDSPQISLDELPATTSESALTVTGTVTDNTEIKSISLIVNEGEAQELGVEERFSQEITLADGKNTVQVEATDVADNSGTSKTVTVNLDTAAPTTAPANLKAQLNVAANAANLTWDIDKQAASYNVYRSDSHIDDATDLSPVLSDISETSANDFGLPVGKTVYYAVTSVDAAENENASVVSNSPNITLITSAGGTASLSDGTKARFGKMALSSNPNLSASVMIEKLDDSTVAELDKAVAGSTREFTATSQTGEAIETLNQPITIAIPYPEEIADSVESPQIRFLEDENWIEIESNVDAEVNLVTAKVSQLGIYRLVEIELHPWDVKANGKVDIFDLVMVGSHFGEKAEPGDRWDVKVDGVVDIFDLVMVGSHFGETYEGASAAPAIVSTGTSCDVEMVAEEVDGIYEVRLETEADSLAGFQFDLHFDSTRLNLLNVTEGNALKANGTKTYWLEPEVENNTAKVASVALNAKQDSSLHDSKAVLATASFELKGNTSEMLVSTALNTVKVEEIRLSDDDGKLIPVRLDNAVKLLSNKVKLRNALLPNYPNPFNPETWIPYSVAQDSTVTVKIYNLLGQTVQKLNLGFVKAGEYISKDKAIYWDGNNSLGESVASGVYFYQLNVLNNDGKRFSATRKLVILK